jgi:hypothetical protein
MGDFGAQVRRAVEWLPPELARRLEIFAVVVDEENGE